MGNDACCGPKADATVTKASSVQRRRPVSFPEFLMLQLFHFVGLPSIAVQKIEELGSMS